MADDLFDLQRFLDAQQETYDQALTELRNGRKTSHWIWFVFPQIHGLGTSAMSQRYAIASIDEARAYLAHPVLGARLEEAAQVVADSTVPTATELMGEIDSAKLRSCMTLFAHADPEYRVYTAVLDKYFDGRQDEATLERITSGR